MCFAGNPSLAKVLSVGAKLTRVSRLPFSVLKAVLGSVFLLPKENAYPDFLGICFLPNSHFSSADSIDLPNKCTENVCRVWHVLVLALDLGKDLVTSAFALCLFMFLPKDALFSEILVKGCEPHTKKRFFTPLCSEEVALFSTLFLSTHFSSQTFFIFF